MQEGSGVRFAVRAALVVAIAACLVAGPLVGARLLLWPAGAILAVGFALAEVRTHRTRAAAARARTRRTPDGREEATRVVIPWRSSPFWDGFDLTVGAVRTEEWFCFYGHAGDPITITVEVESPDAGVRASLLDAGGDDPSLADGTSDESGSLTLSGPTATTGIHYVRVRVAEDSDPAPRRYRMSIAGPRRAREAGPARRHHEGFADVPLWHPFHDAIVAVAEAGLMTGRGVEGESLFGPDHPMWTADFIEILQSCLASLGEDVTGWLEHMGAPVGHPASASAPTRDADRARVTAMTVGILDYAFPGLLERPPAGAVEPDDRDRLPGSSGSPQPEYVNVAEYNGLLAGLESFHSEADLSAPARRGEVAQLLDGVMRLAGGAPDAGRSDIAVRPTAPSETPPLDWDSDAALAREFITGAHEALDTLIGGPDAHDGDFDASVDVDADELRRSIETMREEFADRLRDRSAQPAAADEPAGATPSEPTGAAPAATPGATRNGSHSEPRNGMNGSGRTSAEPLSDAFRSLRDRNGRRSPRFKPRV